MKRSTHVATPLVAVAAAAMLSGCQRPQMKRCVDEHNVVVDDSKCQNQPGTQSPSQPSPIFFPYHYYYGGWGGYGYGSIAGGGSLTELPGHGYVTANGIHSGTIRGGWGSSFSGEGEGGHGAGE
jgi:hypothetical protein